MAGALRILVCVVVIFTSTVTSNQRDKRDGLINYNGIWRYQNLDSRLNDKITPGLNGLRVLPDAELQGLGLGGLRNDQIGRDSLSVLNDDRQPKILSLGSNNPQEIRQSVERALGNSLRGLDQGSSLLRDLSDPSGREALNSQSRLINNNYRALGGLGNYRSSQRGRQLSIPSIGSQLGRSRLDNRYQSPYALQRLPSRDQVLNLGPQQGLINNGQNDELWNIGRPRDSLRTADSGLIASVNSGIQGSNQGLWRGLDNSRNGVRTWGLPRGQIPLWNIRAGEPQLNELNRNQGNLRGQNLQPIWNVGLDDRNVQRNNQQQGNLNQQRPLNEYSYGELNAKILKVIQSNPSLMSNLGQLNEQLQSDRLPGNPQVRELKGLLQEANRVNRGRQGVAQNGQEDRLLDSFLQVVNTNGKGPLNW